MTMMTASRPLRPGLDPLLPAKAGLAVCIALAVPTLLAFALDERTLSGISVWSKPLKFEASIALHLATVTLLAGLLDRETREGALVRWSMQAAGLCGILEILYIVLQAARGRSSHFNFETPLEEALYSLMGVGAVTMIAGSFLLGVLIWRKARPEVGAGARTGAAFGLMLGSAATLVYAGYLGSAGGHLVGGTGSDAGGLPLLGWSTTGGDLRVAHFLATHAMQVLPVLGLLADRLAPRAASRVTLLAAIAYQALPLLAFVQAQSGRPLIAS